MNGDITVLLGTTKGAFTATSNADRTDWTVKGPFCDGATINHVIGDPATGRIWAAGGGGWFPKGVWTSDGGDWALSETGFAESAESIWSVALGPDALYAGSKPANLHRSRDGGTTWEVLPALTEQEGAEDWMPGAAGLTLHTILTDPDDPQKIWVGISAAGFFASEDGGATWTARNRRANADTYEMPSFHGEEMDQTEVFSCIHNAVRSPGDLLYQQNHHGVYRSPDGGRNWTAISKGLPSHFGFPIAVHPHDPQTIWCFPLNGDSIGRYPPDAAAAVWRSRDGGASWTDMRDGLPQTACYFTVLRQAMATDRSDDGGVYFGTNSGSVFFSRDAGDSWDEIVRHLPTILSVEVMDRAHPL